MESKLKSMISAIGFVLALCGSAMALQDSGRTSDVTAPDDSLVVEDVQLPISTFARSLNQEDVERVNYSHFGDVLTMIPGVFVLDRGRVGQPLYCRTFGLPPSQIAVFLDGLDLQDPITWKADLNLVPAPYINSLELQADGAAGELSMGSFGPALLVSGQEHTAVQPSSRVLYRRGDFGYRDVDVGVGMKVHQGSDILLGGLIKGYEGVKSRQAYEAQKIRAKVTSQLGQNWRLRYSMLLNKSEVELLTGEYYALTNSGGEPFRKDRRLDHGLFLRGEMLGSSGIVLESSVRHTDLRREFHDYLTSVRYFEDVGVFAASTSAGFPISQHKFTLGGQMTCWDLDSDFLGEKNEFQFSGEIGGQVSLLPSLRLMPALTVMKHQDFATEILPAFHVWTSLFSWVNLQASYSENIRFPSFEQRISPVGLNECKTEISAERSRVFHLGGEFNGSWLGAYLAGFWTRLNDRITRIPLDQMTAEGCWYGNSAAGRYVGLLAALEVKPFPQSRSGGHFQALNAKNVHGEHVADVPEWDGYAYAEFSHAFFAEDLRLTLRLNCRFLGPRYGLTSVPESADQAFERMDEIAIPSVQLFGQLLQNATVFIAFDNLLDADYQIVYEYPMPGRTFRWGIDWRFVD